MWTPLQRVLSVAAAVAVALLVLVCVSLAHHDDGGSSTGPRSQPSVLATQRDSTAPEPLSGDHCAMSELVACVHVTASPGISLALLAFTALALALALANVPLLPRVRRARVGVSGVDPPTLSAGPSLAALCISRT